ncbi:MAG: ribulose-phosphate 3-epimerase [Puniceicoccaceae bacterium]
MQTPAPVLAPSLLAGNHLLLLESARHVEGLGLDWLHLDIMDGHFVPNLTFGPQMVAGLDKETGLFLDTHLMLSNPQDHINAFIEAGADQITIHIEPQYDHAATLSRIRNLDCLCGLAFNPDTPAEFVLPYLEEVDLILVMTVVPGFGGQSFREDTLPSIEKVAKWRSERGLDFRIQVDGGINLDTALRCRNAGADTFVSGSAFFQSKDPQNFLQTIVPQA